MSLDLDSLNQEASSFNTVSRPGEDDVIDIEVSVKRNTGQISLGAGYSTATGGFLQGSVSQNNFLGKGST